MFKKILIFVLFSVFIMSAFAMTDGPNFVLLPNIKTKYLMSVNAMKMVQIENQVIELVKKTLNINSESPYRTVRIRLIYNDQNEVKALIVYLLSSINKSLDLVRINLNDNFTVASIINDYQLQQADLSQSPNYAHKLSAKCPDDSVQFVIGNNFDGDASVEKEIQRVYQFAKDKGYNPVLMNINDANGPQPTVQAYENWLQCPNVKGFYNESHGWEAGIVLSDDEFMFTRVDRELTNKLHHEIILFDSCLTFHNPLLAAITDVNRGNVQQYIAGFISLPFGASERTAACFWKAAFNKQELNQKMLGDCAKQNRLQIDGFKIDGSGDKYLARAN